MPYVLMPEEEKKRLAVKIAQLIKDEAPTLTVRDCATLLRDTERVISNASPLVVPTAQDAIIYATEVM